MLSSVVVDDFDVICTSITEHETDPRYTGQYVKPTLGATMAALAISGISIASGADDSQSPR
jgi:hypothetical protein